MGEPSTTDSPAGPDTQQQRRDDLTGARRKTRTAQWGLILGVLSVLALLAVPVSGIVRISSLPLGLVAVLIGAGALLQGLRRPGVHGGQGRATLGICLVV